MTDFKAKLAATRAKAALDKQLAKAKAPNMNPSYTHKKEPEPLPPDIAEFNLPAADKLKLTKYILRRLDINKAMAELRVESDALAEAIKPLCKIYSLDKFMVEGNRASYYKTVRSTISKELLLGHNVSPSTIAACTITKESISFRVTAPGEKDEENG